MTAHDLDNGLDARARAALLRWMATHDGDAPSGFADRVLAGVSAAPLPDDEPLLPRFVPVPEVVPLSSARRRPLRRWMTIGAAVLAAAVLVLFVGRTLRAGVEGTERAQRLAALDASPSTGLLELRSAALETLTTECAPCHSSTNEKSVSGALEVFDVQDPRWYLSMSERQLGVAARRLDGTVGGDEADRFRAYVDAEIAHRRASAPLTSM